MKTKCPHCGSRQRIPDEYAGQAIKCPACKSEFSSSEIKEPARSVPIRTVLKLAVGLGGNFIAASFKITAAMIMAAVTVGVIICTFGGLADLPDGGFGGIQFLLGIIALCQIAQFVKNIL